MPIDEQQLTGRVAVVTGGSRGIGRGIAEVLAERGAAVAVAYRERADAASSLVSMIQSNGGRAWAGQCDVTSEPSVTAFSERATREVGPVDILVNNAGIARDTHFMLMDAPRWHDVLATNLDLGGPPIGGARRSIAADNPTNGGKRWRGSRQR